MDYLASEISMQNNYLNKIGQELAIMNRENTLKKHRKTPIQTTIDNKALSNRFKVDEIDRIPSDAFRFETIQEVCHLEQKKWRRYELTPSPYNSLSYYLCLAYSIIKKNLRFDGYNPIEIAITFEKGEIMDNEINIRLTKTNISQSIILKLADFIDYMDLKLTLFVLWTELENSFKKSKKRQISGKTRQNVLMRDNYTCQICGATVKDGAKLEIDHIKPFSKGGTNDENNLQVLCQQCNREKHNRTDLLHDKMKLAELEGK